MKAKGMNKAQLIYFSINTWFLFIFNYLWWLSLHPVLSILKVATWLESVIFALSTVGEETLTSVKNSLLGVSCVSHTGELLVGWMEAAEELAQNR